MAQTDRNFDVAIFAFPAAKESHPAVPVSAAATTVVEFRDRPASGNRAGLLRSCVPAFLSRLT